ncbi:MAG: metallopeptidase family protein [Gemmatimonadetes bacterium]|nr:metallopeptidase family protein [Gemmatimonadota bacterium]
MDDSRVEQLWDEIWNLLEDGRTEAAVQRALEVLNEDDDVPELRYLLGVGLLDLGEPEAAITEFEAAVAAVPDWSDAQAALAWSNFRACRFEAIAEPLGAAFDADPDNADAHQLRALIAERENDEPLAIVEFAEARRLDPERYPEPYSMAEDEFLACAQAVVAELDEPIREVLEETSFFVQPFPSLELLRGAEPALDPQILGLFVGQSLLEQSVAESGALPNTMYLFQRNLERVASSREELEEEIRITVLHEIGHHLGWDEEELEERGLA